MIHRHILAWMLAAATLPAFAEKQYLLEAPADQIGRIAAASGLTVVKQVAANPPTFLVSAPNAAPYASLQSAVRSDPTVTDFEPDSESSLPEKQSPRAAALPSVFAAVQALSTPGAATFYGSTVRAAYTQQPAAPLVRWQDCQQAGVTGTGVVAILDTGVDPTHPALRDVLVPGIDFVAGTYGIPSDLQDLSPAAAAQLTQSTVAILDKALIALLNQSTVAILDQSTVAILDGKTPQSFGHGTMIAGLVHVVAPTARIMPLRVFKADGSTRLSDIIAAIYYAADHGATVINMSFSMTDPSPALAKAINYASQKGVICVASAGNDGKQVHVYPASYSGVFGVGSTTLNDQRSVFSNFGEDSARTAAPGESLVTTYPGNNYAAVWGTSFSAALVSGAVSLMQQVQSPLEFGKIDDALEHGREVSLGMGEARLDAYRSVMYLKQH